MVNFVHVSVPFIKDSLFYQCINTINDRVYFLLYFNTIYKLKTDFLLHFIKQIIPPQLKKKQIPKTQKRPATTIKLTTKTAITKDLHHHHAYVRRRNRIRKLKMITNVKKRNERRARKIKDLK